MSAGGSAELQSQLLARVAASHQRAAADALTLSRNFGVAAVAERRLVNELAALSAYGYYLLPDRKWPGSKSAQLDLVVVGPSGVWIIDSKNWADFSVAAGRMFRGQEDVTDEVSRLADVAFSAEEAFAEVGLAPGEIRVVLAMEGRSGVIGEVNSVLVVGAESIRSHVVRRSKRLTASQVEHIFPVASKYFAVYSGPQVVDPIAVVASPVLAEEQPISEEALAEADLSDSELLELLSAEELAAPVEEWMTFLHPTQIALVRRSFNGPARIRGGAGTGKTVVGLHRAAYLARANPEGRILFTTFVKTLPRVLSNLLARLAPEVADRVDFVHVHGFALQQLRRAGQRVLTDPKKMTQAFSAAWASLPAESRARLVAREGSARNRYWKEEIEHVIKGRGFVSFDEYADCARPGRAVPLSVDDRRAVWALYELYSSRLSAAGVCDFQDLILLAEKVVAVNPPRYSAVIVDEAQDLSLSMIRLLFSLVGDGQDTFTLIGDGQQSIYPGGYVLSEAGISLAGRGVVLHRNYRNTAEIARLAEQTIAENAFVDIDDSAAPAKDESAVPRESTEGVVARSGSAPVEAKFSSRAQHDRAMVERVQHIVDSGAAGWGDVAVLCETLAQTRAAEQLLLDVGIPVMQILDYVGLPVDRVKVGTIKRAKGLEFKSVLLPWSRLVGAADGDEERAAIAVRERYVGVTRARDSLWIGSC